MKNWDPKKLKDIELEKTPWYDQTEDEIQNKKSFPQLEEELEHTPEVADQYIETEALLPKGEQITRGHVVAHSHDTNKNVLVRPMQILFWILDCTSRFL